MKTFYLTFFALITVALVSGIHNRMSAQQSYTIKEYLNNVQYYGYANISFFEVDEPATERLLREHLPNGIDTESKIKAFIVTERYKPGTVPNIFGVVLTSPITKAEAPDPDIIYTKLCSPMRVFDIQDLKAMPTVSPQGKMRGSLEGTPYTTMDAYLTAYIQQVSTRDKTSWLGSPHAPLMLYSNRTIFSSVNTENEQIELLRSMAKGTQIPFDLNPEYVRQYTSDYNAKRQKNPLAALSTLHLKHLQNSNEVKICDSVFMREIQRDLMKAGYKQLSGEIKLTLLGEECIRLQYGILDLMGKALVDAIPNTTRTQGKPSRFSVNKEVKIGETVAANGTVEDVTMFVPGANYCHQITRLSTLDYAYSKEFSWYDKDVPSGSYLYLVDPLNPQPFNYAILTKEYTNADDDILRRRGSMNHEAYKESSGAHSGIALMKEYEYRKAHPNELYKNIPIPPTEPQPFQIAIYADIAKEIGLPEMCNLEQVIEIDYSVKETAIMVYNGGEPDFKSIWNMSRNNFSVITYQHPKKSPPSPIVEKYNPNSNSPFETLVRIQVKNLPKKSPEETRSFRGSVVLKFGYTCSIDGKTEKGSATITVPINVEYK